MLVCNMGTLCLMHRSDPGNALWIDLHGLRQEDYPMLHYAFGRGGFLTRRGYVPDWNRLGSEQKSWDRSWITLFRFRQPATHSKNDGKNCPFEST